MSLAFWVCRSLLPESRYDLTGVVVERRALNQALIVKPQDLREGLCDSHSSGAGRHVKGAGHKFGVAVPRVAVRSSTRISLQTSHIFTKESSNALQTLPIARVRQRRWLVEDHHIGMEGFSVSFHIIRP